MEKILKEPINIILSINAQLLKIVALIKQVENSTGIILRNTTSSIDAVIGNAVKSALDKGELIDHKDVEWVVAALDGLYRISADYTYDTFGFHQSASSIFDSLEEVFRLNEQLRSWDKR